jgi:hypothetical protein
MEKNNVTYLRATPNYCESLRDTVSSILDADSLDCGYLELVVPEEGRDISGVALMRFHPYTQQRFITATCKTDREVLEEVLKIFSDNGVKVVPLEETEIEKILEDICFGDV